MPSEVNNSQGSLLPNQVSYVNIFDRSNLSETEEAELTSKISDLDTLRDALRVAKTNSLVEGYSTVEPETRFPAPKNFPAELIDTDGTTSLADVSAWLTRRGTSPYSASATGDLARLQPGGSRANLNIQLNSIEREIGRLRSTRSNGYEAGVSVVDGTFYINGNVITLSDLIVAIRLNKASNAHDQVGQIVEDIKTRQRLIEAAQELRYALKAWSPADADSKFYFLEYTELGRRASVGTLAPGTNKSLAEVTNEIQKRYKLSSNPLTLFAGLETKTYTFWAASDTRSNVAGSDFATADDSTRFVGGLQDYGYNDAGTLNYATKVDLEAAGFTVSDGVHYTELGIQEGTVIQFTGPAGDENRRTVNTVIDVPYRYQFEGPNIGDRFILNSNTLNQWSNRLNNEVQQIRSKTDRDNLTLDNQNTLFYDELGALNKVDDREQENNQSIAGRF